MGKEIKYDYFGNTTLRVFSLASNIEKQLQLFDQLFINNNSLDWDSSESGLQLIYENLLIKNSLIKSGETSLEKKTKNAREKSSPLENFGLIDRKKKIITAKGRLLLDLLSSELQIWKNKNNFLQIENISLFFLSSFFSYTKEDKREDNFYKYLNVFKAFDFELTDKQFTCLPLINNFELQDFISLISKVKKNEITLDQLIIKATNDKSSIFQINQFKQDISEHKKIKDTSYFSGGKGDKWVPKIQLFLEYCEAIHFNNDTPSSIDSVFNDNYVKNNFIKEIAGGIQLSKRNKVKIHNSIKLYIHTNFSSDFYLNFFYFVKTTKIKRNLYDYKDLNKRYLKLTDSFEFGETVSVIENLRLLFVDPDPRYIVKQLNNFKNFSSDSLNYLENHKPIMQAFKAEGIKNLTELRDRNKNKQIAKIKELLETKFTREKLYKSLIPLFKDRSNLSDQKLIESVSTEANVPTIFEYLIAIAWCYFDRSYDPILSANLSLDTDMLPKSHAGGGQSDIPIDKGDHIVMLEVTLNNKTNQRRAEMESVTRHLGSLLLSIKNMNKRALSYGVFIAPDLDRNVLNDWRVSTKRRHDNNDGSDHIDGMNILALDTDDVINILKRDCLYNEYLQKIRTALDSKNTSNGLKWYEEEVRPIFNS